ncbi:hypothetical protein ADIS_1788 [Lunatimonas lonarensis]|uniref:Uncharacterized protein n=2 Tax=Lunatimonas lonarensis TaxID=1232681 RepID=R7ZV45_9BACT|nr:hypothetical protein ADIS_1788 [Lunatimonas lonarensis]
MFLVCFLMMACTAVQAPKSKVPRLKDIEQDGRGGWIIMHLAEESLEVTGELLSVSDDEIVLLTGGGLFRYEQHTIDRARVVIYNTETAKFGLWTALSSLATVTNGYFLLITAPLNLITGAVVTGTESKRDNYVDFPEDGWPVFRKFARFPQGMPEELQARDLK